MIDDKNKKILRVLMNNARLSIRKIAKITGIKPSSVFQRMKKLEENEIIKGYTVKLNREKMGYGVEAFVLITFKKEDNITQEQVAKELMRIDNVIEVHIITGDWDLLAKVITKDVKDLGKLITEKIRKIKGVDKTFTIVSLQNFGEKFPFI